MKMKNIQHSWSSVMNYIREQQLSSASFILIILTELLLYIFSLPHAIALRKLILVIVFFIALKPFWEALKKKPKPLLLAVLLLIVLELWMLVIAGFISDRPLYSLIEWKGQWLPVLMSFVVGIGIAHVLMQSKIRSPQTAVAMIIMIPVVIFLLINAIVIIYHLVMADRFLPDQLGITDQKGITNYLIALLEPIIIADMLGRLTRGNRLLPIPSWQITAVIILLVFSLFAASSRNGILILLFGFTLGACMMISEIHKAYSRKKIVTSVLSTLIIVLAIGYTSYKTDHRWKTFIATIPIAWNIDRDLLWLNGDGTDLPVTPNGIPVDASEYYRIAWAHEGWRVLMAHPWGTEIARNTFHNLEVEKFGHAGMAHSHNSWIDLGLEVGVQGLFLWGWILFIMGHFGWQVWQTRKELLGLALALLIILFAVRGLLDSIFRDHEIEQFMLVAGLLFGMLTNGRTNSPNSKLVTVKWNNRRIKLDVK